MTTCQTATVMLADSAARVRNILETIVRDEEQLSRLEGILETRKEQTLRQVGGFLRGIEQACRRCETEGQELLERNLSFWRTWRLVFGKAEWQEKFQADLETKMRDLIQPQVENALQLLETDLRSLWPQLQDTMENQFKGDSRRAGEPDDPGFRAATARAASVDRAHTCRADRRSRDGSAARADVSRDRELVARAGGCRGGGRHRDPDRRDEQCRGRRRDRDRGGVGLCRGDVCRVRAAPKNPRRISPADGSRNARNWSPRSSSNYITRSISFMPRSAAVFQPLRAFCAAERKRYDPLLNRVREIEKTFAELSAELARSR